MNSNKFHWLSPIAIIACSPFLAFGQDEVEFSSDFLLGKHKIDVSRYSKGNPVLAGKYEVQVFLNDQQKLSNFSIDFTENGTSQASACLPASILNKLDVDVKKSLVTLPDNDECLKELNNYFPGTALSYDPLKLRMDITIPQAYLLDIPAGTIPPSRWDNGIPALLLAYDTNYYHREQDSASDSAYAGLTYGANYGAWRLRARGALNWYKGDGPAKYDSQSIFLQRDIAPLRAQLVVGDSNTQGNAFDSLNLRGMRLYNDSRMYSTSVTNYAPIVRGVAKGNAKVTVKQNGSTIYQKTVPPGPFTLTDVIPSGFGNDLEVTIEEADGHKEYLTIPYSSVPQLVRKSHARWEFAIGELNNDTLKDKPKVAQVSAYYGFSDFITGYAGIQATDKKYFSALGGVAFNTSLGAIAADITHSQATFDDISTTKMAGESYRVTYSNLLSTTQTSFNIAAYRFSTRNYLTLNDAASLQNDINSKTILNTDNYQRLRDQLQLSINQPLRWQGDDYGSFYIAGSLQTYWGDHGDTQQYSIGYSNSWKFVSYNVSLQRSYDYDGIKNDSVYLNFTVPFNAFTHDHSDPAGFSLLSGGISNDSHGDVLINSSATGATESGKVSYSLNATSRPGDNKESSLGTYLNWDNPYGSINASASVTDGNGSQFSLGNSGGLIVHSGGMTLAPDTIGSDSAVALVHAAGAEGAKLTMGSGEISSFGYGISPYLSPYRENRVGLNIDNIKGDVDVKNTNSTVVPTNGAIIGVNFETDQGRSVLMILTRDDGGAIPLGASVADQSGQTVGSLGQSGYAYVRGIADDGKLQVSWGEKSDEICVVTYHIPASPQIADKTIILSGQRCVMSHRANHADSER
jgi:outer membrane usher protein